MLVVQLKEGESIDRALKRFKRKFDTTKVVKKLREKQQYVKPSVLLRSKKKKAVNTEKYRMMND